MADERSTAPDGVSDEEIAAAVGEELPDQTAMSTVTSGCGPEEFGMVTDSASDTPIPPGQTAVDSAPPEEAEL
jgi:hypothetical protein